MYSNLTIFILMKIQSNIIHFVSSINVTKILSKRAQRAERAGPSLFTQRAGQGRAEKSRPSQS